jgi:HK97 family phage prohead protease
MYRFGIPITKTQKLEDGRLLVSGVFSSETLDKTRDVVDLGATKRAVDRWEAKNLREQHDPKKAVGKALEFEYDEKAGTASFNGFVSAACPDTITKVEDKTLSYFSIGANVLASEAFKAADSKPARRITEYELVEISLVDNPANPDTKLKVAMQTAAGLEETPAAAPPPPEPESPSRFGKALKAAVTPALVPEPPAAAPPPEPVAKTDEPPPAIEPPAPAPAPPEPKPVKKSGEEWDIGMALDILCGLKCLLFGETLDPETEPPAQRKFLETAIEAIQNFIASEAGELAVVPPDASAANPPMEMTAHPTLLRTLARAFEARDKATAARLEAIEKRLAEAPVPFTAPEGEELGTAVGELLTFTKTLKPTNPDADRIVTEKTEKIDKAIGELKTLFEGELKAVRGDLEVIKAMPVPGGPIVRRVPGVTTRSSAPASHLDPEIQVLEKRLANTSDPAARAVYERDLRFARAKKGLMP